MSDVLLAENIRLKQELEALRSLLQRQGASNANADCLPAQATQCSQEPRAEIPPTLVTEHTTPANERIEKQAHDSISKIHQSHDICPTRFNFVEKKATFTWSWQDEFCVWREYDPEICEVCFAFFLSTFESFALMNYRRLSKQHFRWGRKQFVPRRKM